MKILAIETSCDETAIALLEIKGALEKPDIKVLGNTLLSQAQLHEKYGGVYPNLAKREHEKNLPPLLEETLREAKENTEHPDIDCIAVTSGPGLEPALWTGITFAETLGNRWDKPVVPVNHMVGHVFSVLFDLKKDDALDLPALALLVSGGHTELVDIKDFGNYEIIGQTRDDAVGEAFDKVARMLGLPYPGGPILSALAEKARTRADRTQNNAESIQRPSASSQRSSAGKFEEIKLPRPMIYSKDLDFSFSGLKTAVLYKLKSENNSNDEFKEDMARAFEDAVTDVLVKKTREALLRPGKDIKTLIVAGGVSANIHLSRELTKLIKEFPETTLRLPPKSLTTDNAIMIGIAAFIKTSKNPEILTDKTTIKANGNLSISSGQ